MRLLKFFLALAFWVLLLVAIVMFIHFHDFREAYEALKIIDPGKSLSKLDVLREYFAHSDQWNKIYITIIVSVLLVLYVINDYWIKSQFRRLFKRMQGMSYPIPVFGWVIHKSAAAFLVFFQFVAIINVIIIQTAEPYVYSFSKIVERKKYALLLGTNKNLSDDKTQNMYYVYRIDATSDLYKSGKIEEIIISGDKTDGDYNEPLDMKRDLIKRGVPENVISMDTAGFRTLDSVVRLKYHYNINDVVIISQKFHLQRALFLANYYNIKAIGFQAQGTMTKSMVQRELFAKPKVIIDIFVFNMQPKQGSTPIRQQVQFAKPQHKTLVISVVMLLLITVWFFMQTLRFHKY
jgi:SanA protein